MKRTRLRRRSAKKARRDREFRAVKTDLAVRCLGRCEVSDRLRAYAMMVEDKELAAVQRALARCRHRADDPHHVIPGGPDTLANLLGACRSCHDWIHHEEPAVARRAGVLASANTR